MKDAQENAYHVTGIPFFSLRTSKNGVYIQAQCTDLLVGEMLKRCSFSQILKVKSQLNQASKAHCTLIPTVSTSPL